MAKSSKPTSAIRSASARCRRARIAPIDRMLRAAKIAVGGPEREKTVDLDGCLFAAGHIGRDDPRIRGGC
jgi:hypothetical protein